MVDYWYRLCEININSFQVIITGECLFNEINNKKNHTVVQKCSEGI